MNILGINAYHGNSSAAVVCDGELVAAVEEERFNRVKYAAGFPAAAIRYCLEAANLKPAEIDHIAIPRNPWARVATKLFYAARMPSFARERLKVLSKFTSIPDALRAALGCDAKSIRAQYHRVEHHLAHIASAYFVSPYEHAAALSADGLGDFASTMWAFGSGNRVSVLGSVAFPHSLGMYYTALTQYLGFWKFGDEYKVMGLAAYGEPEFIEEFRRIVLSNGGESFRLGLDYFTHHRTGPEMTWSDSSKTPEQGRLFSRHLEERMGPTRSKEEPLSQRHHNIAATMQARVEEVLFDMLRALQKRTKATSLCLAGGVAFNCVANGKIFSQTPFDHVYVQPAAGDAGLAVGAAFHVYHQILGKPRKFMMSHAYWGPGFSDQQMRLALDRTSVAAPDYDLRELDEEHTAKHTAKLIAEGKIVGWYQGRAEWGPRALGNRSIVVDPRRAEMKQILNARVKHREMFRPFAPSVLAERTGEFFECSQPSPFMTFAYSVRPEKRSAIPAPTHVDGTGRLQTVTREANPRYWRLIHAFGELTGVPAVLNTSFNDNEPIVCSPEEAIDCFRRTRMDVLVLGNTIVTKRDSTGPPPVSF